MDLKLIETRYYAWTVAVMQDAPTQDITARLLAREVGGMVEEIKRLRLLLTSAAIYMKVHGSVEAGRYYLNLVEAGQAAPESK